MLPALVEFILSIPREKGSGFCAEPAISQFIIEAFPPDTTMSAAIRPPPDIYANIGYRFRLNPNCVPDSFTWRIQVTGHGLYSGVWTQTLSDGNVDSLIVVTRDSPFYVTGTNLSGLTQYVEYIYEYLVVRSEDDYLEIMAALKDSSNREVVPLLRQAVLAPSAPPSEAGVR